MAVRPILEAGDPRLEEAASPVSSFATPALASLVTDLFDTMRVHEGAGLAAPQIGVPLQVVVFGFNRNFRYPAAPPVPVTVLINPVVTPLGEDTEWDVEGCLSVPGRRSLVERHSAVRYAGYDVQGRYFERRARGFHARVVQHECDHLAGILFPMRKRGKATGLQAHPHLVA